MSTPVEIPGSSCSLLLKANKCLFQQSVPTSLILSRAFAETYLITRKEITHVAQPHNKEVVLIKCGLIFAAVCNNKAQLKL